MPVDNRWYVEDRILLTTLKGRITIEEMLESTRVGTQMIDSGTAPVYVLVDLSELEHFPTRLNQVKQLSDQGTSANLGYIIVYSIPNRLMNFLASMFTQFLRSEYRVAKNQAEALKLIERLEQKPLDQLTA